MILQRYLFRQFASALIYQTAALVAIIYLIQSLRFFKWIAYRQISFSEFIQLSVLLIPQFITYLIPFAVIFSLLYTFYQLKNKQELMAFSVLGISDWKILKPTLLVTLCVVFMQIGLHVIAPQSTQKFQQQEQHFLTRLDTPMIKPGQLQTINNAVVYVGKNEKNNLSDIFLYYELKTKDALTVLSSIKSRTRPDTKTSVLMFVTAKKGCLKHNKIHLEQGHYVQVGNNRQTLSFDTLTYDLGPLKSRVIPLAERLQGARWKCLWKFIHPLKGLSCNKSCQTLRASNETELLLRFVKIMLPFFCSLVLLFSFRKQRFFLIGLACCTLNLTLIGLANILPFSLKILS